MHVQQTNCLKKVTWSNETTQIKTLVGPLLKPLTKATPSLQKHPDPTRSSRIDGVNPG